MYVAVIRGMKKIATIGYHSVVRSSHAKAHVHLEHGLCIP
jgi:hypothetical protein